MAATAAATGALMCRFDTVGVCHALVRTLSVRVGLVAGGMAVLMMLIVAGLLKMTAEDEARRGIRDEARGGIGDEAASDWSEPW